MTRRPFFGALLLSALGLAVGASTAFADDRRGDRRGDYRDNYRDGYRGGYRDTYRDDYRDDYRGDSRYRGGVGRDYYADRCDRYQGYRYPVGRESGETRRRDTLRRRLFDLANRIRLAAREGEINRRLADRLFERLDRVVEFLRDDRYLTDTEYDRRRNDLDEVGEDLRGALRGRRPYSRF